MVGARQARTAGLAAGLVIAALLTLLRWLDPQPVQELRAASLDLYQHLKPRAAVAATPVVTIEIDDAALKAIGQWPWPRARLAELTTRLSEEGAAAIVFDILFSEPDRLSPQRVAQELGIGNPAVLGTLRDGDALFANAIRDRPVVLAFTSARPPGPLPGVKAGFAVTGEDVTGNLRRIEAATLPLPQLATSAGGLGLISLNLNQVGSRVRDVPLLMTDGTALYPALALEALRVALGASTYVVKGDPERAGAVEAIRVGEVSVPLNEHGELRFYAAPDDPSGRMSAARLFSATGLDDAERQRIRGAIVLVGATAAGLNDVRVTPLAQAVSGVSIQAQVLQQMLNGQFLHRPAWLDGAEVLGMAALSAFLVVLSYAAAPALSFPVAGGVIALLLGLCWYLFTRMGLLVDAAIPLGGALLTAFSTTAFWYLIADRERRAIRRAFGKYVSPAVLARIEQSPDGLQLGGVIREITVLFMDVRNFTTLAERLPPEETVRVLNILLGAMSAPVIALEGTLDKYIGDSIMAFWNAPLDDPDHARKAALAALRMREALQALNRADAFGLGPGHPLEIGIGINTGIACVGNMGTAERLSYSAIGDAVNTAARIETACKELGAGILVSAATARRLSGFTLHAAGELHLKGKSEGVTVFSLAALA